MLEGFVLSGAVAWLMLAVMLAEIVVLARLWRRLPVMLWGLLAGAALVLALRAAVLDHGAAWIVAFISLSFVFHVLEVRQWLRLAKQPL
jgi:hypothetical protein